MEYSNLGIGLEILGFIFLSLTAGRNPYAVVMTMSGDKKDNLSKIREKLIPDKFVICIFIAGFVCVIIGLILQLSP